MAPEMPPAGQSSGPATDRSNVPVIDPTHNVLQLVEAAVKRLDDLMEARTLRSDDLRDAWIKRIDDLREVEAQHIREISRIRAEYESALRDKETARIDAIRAVDVSAVARASEVATAQASTLATQVQVSAETLRNQVQAAAIATATALAQALEPVQKSIDDLRKTQYEQQGQRQQQTEGRGNNQWVIGTIIGVSFSVVGLLVTIAIVVLNR